MADPEALKKGAVMAATFDTFLQVGLRILSFMLNAFIVRHVSHEVFAVMTVRLHLLYATGLLLSREAFRRAALSSKGFGQIHKLINLIWIGWVVSVPVGWAGWYVWTWVMARPPEDVAPNYEAAVLCVVVSILVEVAAEVPFVLAELQLWTKTRVAIEGIMQTLRSVLLATFVYTWPSQSVLMYGIGHLLGSLVYAASYYILFASLISKSSKAEKLPIHNFRQLFPTWDNGKWMPSVDKELGRLAWSFFQQGWLKEALTEGEFYLMNFFSLISLAQQGVYQVVNNLGSLAARLVFRSIETAAYKYFAQLMNRGKTVVEQDQQQVGEVVKFLSSILHNLVLVSLIIVTFGWSYSSLLLQLYGGVQLSESGTHLMRAQSLYVVFLAINGITEAYTFASMDDSQLSQFNRILVILSVIYVGMSVALTQLFGAVGFIFANSLNMSLRILYSLRFIHVQYRNSCYKPLTSLLINPKILLIFVAALPITSFSENFVYPKSVIGHLIIGASTLLLVVYGLRWELRSLIEKLLDSIINIFLKFFPITFHYYFQIFMNAVRRILYDL